MTRVQKVTEICEALGLCNISLAGNVEEQSDASMVANQCVGFAGKDRINSQQKAADNTSLVSGKVSPSHLWTLSSITRRNWRCFFSGLV